MIYGAKVDFIVFDYLSEITMSLLVAGKHKNQVRRLWLSSLEERCARGIHSKWINSRPLWFQNMGYAPDFVTVSMAPFIKDIKKKGKFLSLLERECTCFVFVFVWWGWVGSIEDVYNGFCFDTFIYYLL